MDAIGSPLPATVLAIGLSSQIPGKSTPLASREIFATQVGGAIAKACAIQGAAAPHGELALSIIVPDHIQVVSLLRRIDRIRDEFQTNLPDLSVRLVLHHGIVFPTANGHVGAVLRSAHSRLQRLQQEAIAPACVATTDFIHYSASWPTRPITFAEQASDRQNSLYAFSVIDQASLGVDRLDQTAWINYLSTRLADQLGPFARVLVDAAYRASANPRQLIHELSSEIDDLPARQRFQDDALDYLQKGLA